MSVYNAESHVLEATASIRNQTLTDYEFIIIDDGSRDRTLDLIQKEAERDSRIRIFENAENRGLTESLNLGLKHSRGRFIARQDADDVALPNRLEEQLRTFNENSNLVLCGSNVIMVDKQLRPLTQTRLPTDDNSIRAHCLFINPFFHSTVMFRTETIRRFNLKYDLNFKTTQDYEFWIRLLDFGLVENLGEPLVYFRRHEDSVSSNRILMQSVASSEIQERYAIKVLQSCGVEDYEIKGIQFENKKPANKSECFSMSTVNKCRTALEIITILDKHSCFSLSAKLELRQFVVSVCFKTAMKNIWKEGAVRLVAILIARYQMEIVLSVLPLARKMTQSYRIGGLKGLLYSVVPEHSKLYMSK
jgi:hypothetical protein